MVAEPSRSTSSFGGRASPSTVVITACVLVADGGLIVTAVLVPSSVTAGNSAVLVVADVE